MSLVPYIGRCVTCGHNHGDPFAAAPTDAGELPAPDPNAPHGRNLALAMLVVLDQASRAEMFGAGGMAENLREAHADIAYALATQHRAAVDGADASLRKLHVKLLYGFMLDCNAVGPAAAGLNLYRSMKEQVAALQEPK